MTLVWVFAIAGLIASYIVYHFFSREHYKHYEDTLINMCDERARMLQHQFAVSMNHVHALAILVSTFHLGKHPSAIDQVSSSFFTSSIRKPLSFGSISYPIRLCLLLLYVPLSLSFPMQKSPLVLSLRSLSHKWIFLGSAREGVMLFFLC